MSENKYELTEDEANNLLQETVVIKKSTEQQCYCSEPRDYVSPEFLCSKCSKWFHRKCIEVDTGPVVPFMISYFFTCKECNEEETEVFCRKQHNFLSMCQTALGNLFVNSNGHINFSKTKHIIPFLEDNWNVLTTQPKKSTEDLDRWIEKTLITFEIFTCYEYGNDLIATLRFNMSLDLLKPNYEEMLVTQIKLNADTASNRNQLKRKSPTVKEDSETVSKKYKTRADTNNKKNPEDKKEKYTPRSKPSQLRRCESFDRCEGQSKRGEIVINNEKLNKKSNSKKKIKITKFNYPVDHPFNVDNYRYIYVENDPHAEGRQTWEDLHSAEGKAIPGFFYRSYIDQQLVLSSSDIDKDLKLSEHQLEVTGDKGYCMARATHSVSRGVWYYEAEIIEQPEGSHARIGWSQACANLQSPCGFDKFGYSIRSRMGTAFHQSTGSTYMRDDERGGTGTGDVAVGAPGYTRGDVLGCMFHALPSPTADLASYHRESALHLPESFKDRPLIQYKGSYFFEVKENPKNEESKLKSLSNSKLIFYKNGISFGVAFTEIFDGLYYPTVSVYKPCTVRVNFGPNFRYPPNDIEGWKPMCERYESLVTEQLLSDSTWFTSNNEKVKKTINGSS